MSACFPAAWLAAATAVTREYDEDEGKDGSKAAWKGLSTVGVKVETMDDWKGFEMVC